MVIEQSRYQNVFNRIYVSLHSILWVAIGAIGGYVFNPEAAVNLVMPVAIILLAAISISVWLMVFNTGKSRLLEYGFEITESGFSFIKYGGKEHIPWSDFQTFSIKSRFPKIIIIHRASPSTVNKGNDISFSYYTFSAEQRKVLFNALSRKQKCSKPNQYEQK